MLIGTYEVFLRQRWNGYFDAPNLYGSGFMNIHSIFSPVFTQLNSFLSKKKCILVENLFDGQLLNDFQAGILMP